MISSQKPSSLFLGKIPKKGPYIWKLKVYKDSSDKTGSGNKAERRVKREIASFLRQKSAPKPKMATDNLTS
jgi:hypothetical protein